MFISVSRSLEANVENLSLIGSRAAWAFGNQLANFIRGNDVSNALVGGAGDDWISGGLGNDRITGGEGIDHLVGNGGSDMFFFTDATGRDVVHGFETGRDRLNLAAIDANINLLGDQAFTLIGDERFSGRSGELRYDGSNLTGDVNGDAAADFTVVIANDVPLTTSDLIL